MSGVRGLRSGLTSIARMNKAIRSLPTDLTTIEAAAKDIAVDLDQQIRADFASGVTVYDTPRPRGVEGQRLSLVKSGKVRDALGFVAVGTIVRARLGQTYARFLVGKYKILPQSLPASWTPRIRKILARHLDRYMADAGAVPR